MEGQGDEQHTMFFLDMTEYITDHGLQESDTLEVRVDEGGLMRVSHTKQPGLPRDAEARVDKGGLMRGPLTKQHGLPDAAPARKALHARREIPHTVKPPKRVRRAEDDSQGAARVGVPPQKKRHVDHVDEGSDRGQRRRSLRGGAERTLRSTRRDREDSERGRRMDQSRRANGGSALEANPGSLAVGKARAGEAGRAEPEVLEGGGRKPFRKSERKLELGKLELDRRGKLPGGDMPQGQQSGLEATEHGDDMANDLRGDLSGGDQPQKQHGHKDLSDAVERVDDVATDLREDRPGVERPTPDAQRCVNDEGMAEGGGHVGPAAPAGHVPLDVQSGTGAHCLEGLRHDTDKNSAVSETTLTWYGSSEAPGTPTDVARSLGGPDLAQYGSSEAPRPPGEEGCAAHVHHMAGGSPVVGGGMEEASLLEEESRVDVWGGAADGAVASQQPRYVDERHVDHVEQQVDVNGGSGMEGESSLGQGLEAGLEGTAELGHVDHVDQRHVDQECAAGLVGPEARPANDVTGAPRASELYIAEGTYEAHAEARGPEAAGFASRLNLRGPAGAPIVPPLPVGTAVSARQSAASASGVLGDDPSDPVELVGPSWEGPPAGTSVLDCGGSDLMDLADILLPTL